VYQLARGTGVAQDMRCVCVCARARACMPAAERNHRTQGERIEARGIAALCLTNLAVLREGM
jgi:hypothetical protein